MTMLWIGTAYLAGAASVALVWVVVWKRKTVGWSPTVSVAVEQCSRQTESLLAQEVIRHQRELHRFADQVAGNDPVLLGLLRHIASQGVRHG